MKFFSMFSGVGGFELGLSQHECVGVSEIDKYASELLGTKFPGVKNYGDATKIRPEELPDFDLLCGGFPCQAFSIAGKRRGFEDTRGTLFFEVARIVKVKRPKIVFLENVKGLLNHEQGQTFGTIIQALSELGYDVQWLVVNSKFFGVPQNRERVFIVGSLRGSSRPEILPFGNSNEQVNEKNIIVEGMLFENGWDKRHESIRRVYNQEGISPALPTGMGGGVMPKITIQSHSPRTNDPKLGGSGPLRSVKHCFTLDRSPHYVLPITEYRHPFPNSKPFEDYSPAIKGSQGSGNQIIVNKVRRLTPLECERLQGFPDGWTEGFSDTQRYKMMGNAVTVNVIRAIGEKLF